MTFSHPSQILRGEKRRHFFYSSFPHNLCPPPHHFLHLLGNCYFFFEEAELNLYGMVRKEQLTKLNIRKASCSSLLALCPPMGERPCPPAEKPPPSPPAFPLNFSPVFPLNFHSPSLILQFLRTSSLPQIHNIQPTPCISSLPSHTSNASSSRHIVGFDFKGMHNLSTCTLWHSVPFPPSFVLPIAPAN